MLLTNTELQNNGEINPTVKNTKPVKKDDSVTNTRILEQVNQALGKMLDQEKAISRVNSLLLLGFSVLLITVASLVIAYMLSLLQSANQANTLTNDSLNSLHIEVNDLKNEIKLMNNSNNNMSSSTN